MQSQPSIATSRAYEAWIFTGEVEKSYPIERIRIGERGLTELAAKSQSSSVLSSLALLSPNHRKAVNKLLERDEYEKASITGLIPIEGKKSWWTRLTPRRPKDRHPQVVILLQLEQDGERDGGPMRRGKRDYGREEIVIRRGEQDYEREEIIVRREEQDRGADDIVLQATAPRSEYEQTILFSIPKDQGQDQQEKEPASPPSQEEAEKLIDEYLAGFTTFSDDGEDGGERGPRGHDTDGVPEDSAVKT